MDAEKLERWADPRVILVATNLADEEILVSEAASQARSDRARILLVHVLRPAAPQPIFHTAIRSPITGSRYAAAWDGLCHMAKMIEWQGAVCEPMLAEGEPAEKIPEVVRTRGVDRVIVATRSMRGLERLIAGSVAEAVMDAVDVPVWVIGPHVPANPFRSTRAGHILLALSLRHDRADYAEFAASLAAKRQSTLTLLHVVDTGAVEEAAIEVALSAARSRLEKLANSIQPLHARTDIAVRNGAVAHAILEEDVCPGPDFIVMGSPSLGVISKLLGSNVVHGVIAGARCPVITLRPPASREWERQMRDAEGRIPDGADLEANGLHR